MEDSKRLSLQTSDRQVKYLSDIKDLGDNGKVVAGENDPARRDPILGQVHI